MYSAGKVDLDAENTGSINAAVVSASASIAVGGIAGVGASIGVAVARNYIGWNPDYNEAPDYTTADNPNSIATGDTVEIESGATAGNIYVYIGAASATRSGGGADWLAGLDYADRSKWRLVYIKTPDYETGDNPASIATGETVKIAARRQCGQRLRVHRDADPGAADGDRHRRRRRAMRTRTPTG